VEGGKETNYWPGFVDALANVVVTMVFVLVVFVIALLYFAQNKAKEATATAVAQAEAKAAQADAKAAGAAAGPQAGGATPAQAAAAAAATAAGATPRQAAAAAAAAGATPEQAKGAAVASAAAVAMAAGATPAQAAAAAAAAGATPVQAAGAAAGAAMAAAAADAALTKRIEALQKENQQLRQAANQAAAKDSTTPTPAAGSVRPQAGTVSRSELKVAEQVTAPGTSTAPAQIRGALGAIEIIFPSGVTELDKESVGKLEAAFAALGERAKTGGLELVSVPEAGGAYSEGRRLAYYRNLAVRNWLIERGLPSSAVKMRIADRDTGKPNAVLMVSPSAS
jgi:hypothetical protein